MQHARSPPAHLPTEAEAEPQPVAVRLAEALRDAQLKYLGTLKLDKEAEALQYSELRAELMREWPKHLPLLQVWEVLSMYLNERAGG